MTNATATKVTMPTDLASDAATFARIVDRALKAWAAEPQPGEVPAIVSFDLRFGDVLIAVAAECSPRATVLDIDKAMHDAWRRIATLLGHEVVTWKSAR